MHPLYPHPPSLARQTGSMQRKHWDFYFMPALPFPHNPSALSLKHAVPPNLICTTCHFPLSAPPITSLPPLIFKTSVLKGVRHQASDKLRRGLKQQKIGTTRGT